MIKLDGTDKLIITFFIGILLIVSITFILSLERQPCMDKCEAIGEFKSYNDGLCRCIRQEIVELKDLEKPVEKRTQADESLKIMHGNGEELLSKANENFSLTLVKPDNANNTNKKLDDTDVLYYEVNK